MNTITMMANQKNNNNAKLVISIPILLLAIVLCSSLSFGVLQDGLLNYWSFDESVGNISADSMNNASINWTSTAVNVTFGTGSVFSKLNKSISVAVGGAGDVGSYSAGEQAIYNRNYTFNVFFNSTSTSDYQLIFSKWYDTEATQIMFAYTYPTGDNMGFMLGYGGNNDHALDCTIAKTSFLNKNHMLTISFKDNSNVLGYVDGVLCSNKSYSVSPRTDNPVSFTIARHSIVSGDSFQGKLDEMGIWGRTLSQTEVTQLYSNGNGAKYVNGQFVLASLTDNLIHAYDFENNSYDSISSGTNLTYTDNINYASGKVGNSVYFNSGGCANASISISGTDICTNFWTYTTSVDQYDTYWKLFSGSGSNLNEMMYDYPQASNLNFGNEGTTNNIYTANPTLNKWVMITSCTKSGNTSIYYDGVLKVSNTGYNGLDTGSVPFSIGGRPDNGRSINGYIDSFYMWNRILTESEITQLYNGGNGLSYSQVNGSTPFGGTITTDGNYTIHTFLTNGTFTVPSNLTKNVSILVVAGGGSGGGGGGGGGAGGLIYYNNNYSISNGTYQITVGTGGIPVTNSPGTNGENSIFNNLTAIGGGAGGSGSGGAGQNAGKTGGSGGGGAPYAGNGDAGSGTAGQGNNGGTGYDISPYTGGGGGGAGGVGASASSGVAGNGGIGLNISINGSTVCYAGGGAGTLALATSTAGIGVCGGGNGSVNDNAIHATSGINGTGGGGGGTSGGNTPYGYGGSGVVIIRYLTDQTIPPATNGLIKFHANAVSNFTINETKANDTYFNLTAGAYNVTAQANGYLTQTFEINVTAGQDVTYNVTFIVIPTGIIKFQANSSNGTMLVSNYTISGTTKNNNTNFNLTTGLYNVTAQSVGYISQNFVVNITQNQDVTYNLSMLTPIESLALNMVAYYDFENDYNDKTANNNDFIIQNGASNFKTGKKGNGINISHDINVQSNVLSGISGSQPSFSIAFWYSITESISGYSAYNLVGLGNLSDGTNFIGDYLTKSFMSPYNSVTGNGIYPSVQSHSDSTWNFIVMRYNNATKNFDLYSDSQFTNEGYNNISADITINKLMLTVGGIGGATAGEDIIDEVGVWNKYISNDEINTLYNSGNGLAYNDIIPIQNGTIKFHSNTLSNFTVNGTKLGNDTYFSLTPGSYSVLGDASGFINQTFNVTINELDNITYNVTFSRYANGDGSLGNPYQIIDANGLNFTRLNLTANYKLMNDINMDGFSWQPIGKNFSSRFQGTFDGNGKTIINLTITDTTNNVGLFGTTQGKINNLSLQNVYIPTSGTTNYVGGIAGAVYGNGGINNSFVSGYISGNTGVGGIAGLTSGDTSYIDNCTINITYINGNSGVGLLVGLAYGVMDGYPGPVINSVANVNTNIANNLFNTNFIGASDYSADSYNINNKIFMYNANGSINLYTSNIGISSILGNNINIGSNLVGLNSEAVSDFNKSATITIKDVPVFGSPVILRNGVECLDCSEIVWNGQDATFNVTGFSNYSIGNGDEMPVVNSSRISPINPNSTSTLQFYCNATDTDDDNMTYIYNIYENNTLIFSGQTGLIANGTEVNVYNLTTNVSRILYNYTLECQANDSSSLSAKLNSTVTIQNILPQMTSTRFFPALPDTTSNLVMYCTATDYDGQMLRYNYSVYKNNILLLNNLTTPEISGTEFRIYNVSGLTQGDNYSFSCKAFDGLNFSTELNQTNAQVREYVALGAGAGASQSAFYSLSLRDSGLQATVLENSKYSYDIVIVNNGDKVTADLEIVSNYNDMNVYFNDVKKNKTSVEIPAHQNKTITFYVDAKNVIPDFVYTPQILIKYTGGTLSYNTQLTGDVPTITGSSSLLNYKLFSIPIGGLSVVAGKEKLVSKEINFTVLGAIILTIFVVVLIATLGGFKTYKKPKKKHNMMEEEDD